MTRARDDRRRNNRAAFVESFARPGEWTHRAAAAITDLTRGYRRPTDSAPDTRPA